MKGNLGNITGVHNIADDAAKGVGIDVDAAKEELREPFEEVHEDADETLEDEDEGENEVPEVDEEDCAEQIDDAMAEKAKEDAAANTATLVADNLDDAHDGAELDGRFDAVYEQIAALTERVRVLESSR